MKPKMRRDNEPNVRPDVAQGGMWFGKDMGRACSRQKAIMTLRRQERCKHADCVGWQIRNKTLAHHLSLEKELLHKYVIPVEPLSGCSAEKKLRLLEKTFIQHLCFLRLSEEKMYRDS